ncbi:MAG: hypothetical protein ABIC04_02735 [Nanoarchaeota archaeon]
MAINSGNIKFIKADKTILNIPKNIFDDNIDILHKDRKHYVRDDMDAIIVPLNNNI